MMNALDYLHAHGLSARPLPGGDLGVSPRENVTGDLRGWIRANKTKLLAELASAAKRQAAIKCDSCNGLGGHLSLVGSIDSNRVYAICGHCFALDRPDGFWTICELTCLTCG